MKRPTTVFLDRDGTLNVKAPEGEYVNRPGDLTLLPRAAAAVRRLNGAGVRVVLVTNQRGVARGIMSDDDVRAVHERLAVLLAREGAHLDAVYYCPHDHGACTCRKPSPGLVRQAVQDDPSIDLARAVVVGDADSDIELGLGLGLDTLRVGEGTRGVSATWSCSDLDAGVTLLLEEEDTG